MQERKDRILLVEDEVNIAEIVIEYLEKDGFDVEHVTSGTVALKKAQEQLFDLMLLDVMLPGLSGFDVCREIRKTSQLPIIIVTARVEEIDRLIGLEFGADDYICKPFSPREVVARVKAVLRRHKIALTSHETEKLIVIDCDAFSVKIKGRAVDLTPSEFKLLAALAAHPSRVMSRTQLLDVLSDEKDVFDRTIDSHIKNIRKKLNIYLADQEIIQTIYGVGYRYELV